MRPRQARCDVLEVSAEVLAGGFGLRPRLVEQRAWEHDAEERVAMDVVGWVGNHAQSSDHIGDDRIVRKSATVRETAGNIAVDERRLENMPDLMRSIEE